MVYAALDNNLECVALRALAEQLSGLTDQCYVVAAFEKPFETCDNHTCVDTERAGDEYVSPAPCPAPPTDTRATLRAAPCHTTTHHSTATLTVKPLLSGVAIQTERTVAEPGHIP
jgi:hypothetical protein